MTYGAWILWYLITVLSFWFYSTYKPYLTPSPRREKICLAVICTNFLACAGTAIYMGY